VFRYRMAGVALVESRMGAGADAEAPSRFPSPLVKPDVPISGIRLSDWFHRRLTNEAPAARSATGRHPVRQDLGEREGSVATRWRFAFVLRLAIQLDLEFPEFTGVIRLIVNHPPSLCLKHTMKQGPFALPALPGFSAHMALSDAQAGRRPFRRRSETLPPPGLNLPQLPGSPFLHAVLTTPVDRLRCTCRLPASLCRAAFPVKWAGRHPHLHFRGLLKLHSRYGLQDCSPTIRGLCHEASPYPRSPRASDARQLPSPTDNYLGGSFPHWSSAPLGRTTLLRKFKSVYRQC
jgi:hypothetical protein